jgi:hypothetical protein
MTPQRIAPFAIWIVITSAAATAQQQSETASVPPASATTVTERTYPDGGRTAIGRIERRTESGGRKVLIETTVAPNVEGRRQPVEEVVTDASRTTTPHTRMQRDVSRFDLQGRRMLAETTQSEGDASARNVRRTWVADADGRLTLSSGYVEETTSTSPGIQRTDATLLLLSPEGALREAARSESTEQQVGSGTVRRDSTYLVRDPNGRWTPTEARSGETRGVGSPERVEEETIRRPNVNGALVLSDKVVTRTSESNGDIRVVVETYSQSADGLVRSDSRLALRQRATRSTTVTADGGRSTVEEVEARNPVAPNDPMRVIRRTLTTTRIVTPGRWVTHTQIFERDPNGRMVLVANDTEEPTGK